MGETVQIKKVDFGNCEEIFSAAYDGSYYTILGCGGNLDNWTSGYREMLESEGIGSPKEFITFKGADMNEIYGLTGNNAYDEGLTFLMFPLDGLNVPKLAIFKLRADDRWFDDIVDNNRRHQEVINEQG